MLQVELHNAIADPDLVAVIDAWLSLPKPVKAGIVAMVVATSDNSRSSDHGPGGVCERGAGEATLARTLPR